MRCIILWILDQVQYDVVSCPAVSTLWIPAYAGMTDRVGMVTRRGVSPLWIDESPMNLCEILGFQPKGVNALSFSSRKRPAFAGMTGRVGVVTQRGVSPSLWIADQVRNDVGVVAVVTQCGVARAVDTGSSPV